MPPPPSFLFIFADDHRHDMLGVVDSRIKTPHLDRLARESVWFRNAHVTTAICSPSRATCLSGQYGSRNGVPTLAAPLRHPNATVIHALRGAGYATLQAGKWHLGTSPQDAGFEHIAAIHGNGSWFERSVETNIPGVAPELGGIFIEQFTADVVIDWLERQVTETPEQPTFAWMCSQVPHLDGDFRYPDVTLGDEARENIPWGSEGGYWAAYDVAAMEVPASWADDPATWDGAADAKPPYLATSRFVTHSAAHNYGGPGGYINLEPGERHAFRGQDNVQQHQLEYAASISALDHQIGRVLAWLETPRADGTRPSDTTWVVYMGDNGWQTGSHRFTSKVLAYEESTHVPLMVRAPGVAPREEEKLALNLDLPAMFASLALGAVPDHMQGADLSLLVRDAAAPWREHYYYEAVIPDPGLGAMPHDAVRTGRHKLIHTYADEAAARASRDVIFEELYDLESDPGEMRNLASLPEYQATVRELASKLEVEKASIAASPEPG